jgi:hypothetical protein
MIVELFYFYIELSRRVHMMFWKLAVYAFRLRKRICLQTRWGLLPIDVNY